MRIAVALFLTATAALAQTPAPKAPDCPPPPPINMTQYEERLNLLAAGISRDGFIVGQVVAAAGALQDFQVNVAVQKALDRIVDAQKRGIEKPPASPIIMSSLNALAQSLGHAREQGSSADTRGAAQRGDHARALHPVRAVARDRHGAARAPADRGALHDAHAPRPAARRLDDRVARRDVRGGAQRLSFAVGTARARAAAAPAAAARPRPRAARPAAVRRAAAARAAWSRGAAAVNRDASWQSMSKHDLRHMQDCGVRRPCRRYQSAGMAGALHIPHQSRSPAATATPISSRAKVSAAATPRSTTSIATSLAFSIKAWSRTMLPKRNRGTPDCFVPRNSPGPRSSRSRSATSKPLLVCAKRSRRSLSLSETRMQYDLRAPRPTRPRSWWSCERPKRSASTMSMIEAFGTSMPTSITVVETSMSSSPLLKSCIVSSFSAALIRPCSMAMRRFKKRCVMAS